MNYMGIDQSVRNTGICVMNDDNFQIEYLGTYKTDPKDSDIERYYLISNFITQQYRKYYCKKLILEGYAFNKFGMRSLSKLYELGGIIKYVAQTDLDTDAIQISPTQHKKATTGRGNCKKDEMVKAVTEKFKIPGKINDNEADAVSIVYTYLCYKEVYDEKKH